VLNEPWSCHEKSPEYFLSFDLKRIGVFCDWKAHIRRKPPHEYFPTFDLRDLSTIEELEWATGVDVTGGKEYELNVFDRDRLKERMVRLCGF